MELCNRVAVQKKSGDHETCDYKPRPQTSPESVLENPDQVERPESRTAVQLENLQTTMQAVFPDAGNPNSI